MTQNVKGSPGRGKLTKDDIKDIREQYRFGTMNQYQLATKYKVDQSTISGIVNNRYYKDINYNEDLALNNRLKAIEAENGRLKKGLESLKKHTKYIEEQVKDLQEWKIEAEKCIDSQQQVIGQHENRIKILEDQING
jgi:hypothetical protein